MRFRHATLRQNLETIRPDGLLCSKSQGKRKAVWLHVPSRTAWAMLHVVKRHGGKVEDVVVLEVDVPRSQVRKSTRGHIPLQHDDILDLTPVAFHHVQHG